MRHPYPLVPLAELCEVFTDGNWVQTKDQSPSGVRLIQTGNVGTGVFKNRLSKARFVSEKTFQDMKCTEVLPGDCLISRLPDPVGRACIIPKLEGRIITAVDCSIVRLNEDRVLPAYFNYYAQSSNYFTEVEAYCTGATRKRISRKNLGKVQVPVPSLSEQKRIVAILDEALAGIETAITNIEKNLANAQELFASHLNTVFDAGRTDWQKTTLGELYRIGSSKRVHKKDWRDRGVPFYRAREIVKLAENGVVDNELFISEELFEEYGEKTGVPQDDDLMVTAVGTLGICYVVQPTDRFYFKDASVLWFRPKAQVNAKFIQYAFRSPVVKRQTTDSQGATVGTLTISRANSISITVPEVEVQDEIARSLEEIESGILELRAVQQRKLDALRELKQSLLQKAFSGELTADRAEREVESATA